MFPAVFKPREIPNQLKVTVCFIPSPVAFTSEYREVIGQRARKQGSKLDMDKTLKLACEYFLPESRHTDFHLSWWWLFNNEDNNSHDPTCLLMWSNHTFLFTLFWLRDPWWRKWQTGPLSEKSAEHLYLGWILPLIIWRLWFSLDVRQKDCI